MATTFNGITVFVALCMLLHFIPSISDDAVRCLGISSDEVETLHQIAKEVKKPNWNCTADPCDMNTQKNCWNLQKGKAASDSLDDNIVACECIEGRWHVSNISWKGLKLPGVLPQSLAKLPHIKKIDLSRNFLTGTIPEEWTNTKLEWISLFANQLSGPIPSYLGNITTLTHLVIESNQFNGSVPPELGKLIHLDLLALSDNNLSGQLPVELKNLQNLTELQCSSNNFSGSLPADFFQGFTKLRRLRIQGSGLKGPIPPSVSQLVALHELIISDLNGEDNAFPQLQNLKELTALVLRSCNIDGHIPAFIGGMPLLGFLDLSFNNFKGPIPSELQPLSKLKNLYLTSNMLSGGIPTWIRNRDDSRFDLPTLNIEHMKPKNDPKSKSLGI